MFKDPIKLKECQHRWYLAHKEISLIRSSESKRRRKEAREALINNPEPPTAVPEVQTTPTTSYLSPRLPGETHKDFYRSRSLEYYYKNRTRILEKYKANYQDNKTASIDPNYISPRLDSLIKEFGDVDGRWFNEIRIGICAGISTKNLPEDQAEKWWGLLKSRIVKHVGKYCFNKPSGGKYAVGLWS